MRFRVIPDAERLWMLQPRRMNSRSLRGALCGCVAALAGVLLAAGCSSGDSPGADEDQFQSSAAANLAGHAACMRQHGITDFPDPTDDGIDLSTTDIDEDSPAFQDALGACEQLDPANQTFSTTDSGTSAVMGWEKVVPGGQCACSDGSAFSFLVHEGDPSRVLVYLEGGGACFTAELCDPANEIYRVDAERPAPAPSGIFALDDRRNPFADYALIYVPYCTADVFLGNATTTYRSGLTIEHRGFANGTAAVDYVSKTFPQANQVVVTGGSAGAVASPVYGALVHDRLPDARVTVVADGSGGYPDLDRLNDTFARMWGTDDAIGALIGSRPRESWSIPGLFELTAHNHPDVVLARHDYAYDQGQAIWYPRVGLPTGDLLQRIDANERRIERAGVALHSYTAPGRHHVALNDDRFYSESVNGVKLSDWTRDLVAGRPVDDVHCSECR